MWAQILCYKNQGIHWYHCNPIFLWKINFTLVRRLISALIWDISGLSNRSDGRDYREKRIVISRFLALYIQKRGYLSLFTKWLTYTNFRVINTSNTQWKNERRFMIVDFRTSLKVIQTLLTYFSVKYTIWWISIYIYK